MPMLKISCNRCHRELEAPGALLFSPPPPEGSQPQPVQKYHLCADCWGVLEVVVAMGSSLAAPVTPIKT